MWNMIAKDLYLQRVSMTLAVLAGVAIGIFFSISFWLYPVVGFIVIVTYTYTSLSCYHEDKDKSMSFLRSLPVPARVVVNSKFAPVIVLEAVVLIPLFFLPYLGKIAGIPDVSAFSADFSFVIRTVLFVLLLNSIALFIYFRWGNSLMQWVYTMSFFVVFIGMGQMAPDVTVFLTGISPRQGTVLIAALVLLVVFLCWKGSVSALSKKI